MKKCPYCAEDIQDAAIKCRHCGSALDAPPSQASTTPIRRFQNVTESDARLLPEGAVIELNVGGRISPRVEELLASKRVTVRRTVAESAASASFEKPEASSQTPQRRQLLAVLAIPVGFVLTLVSSSLAGLGFIVLWCGIAFTVKGSGVVRWGGGFMAAIILFSVGMAMGSPARPRPAAVSTVAAAGIAGSGNRTSSGPSVPRASCLKIDNFDSSVLSSNDVFTELAWKVDVLNSCNESFPAQVTFTISDKDDFELDTDRENIIVPANGTGNARGKMLVSPPEKARRMAKQGARVRLR